MCVDVSTPSGNASPLVISTTRTEPPAASTRWISPAAPSTSSSGCGDTTSSRVPGPGVDVQIRDGMAPGPAAAIARSAIAAAGRSGARRSYSILSLSAAQSERAVGPGRLTSSMFSETFQDVPHRPARDPCKERGFSALGVIVLALGICGVTTMFSVVNGVMLRGFSFPNAAPPRQPELRRSHQRQLLRRQRPGLARWTSRSSCPSSSRSTRSPPI